MKLFHNLCTGAFGLLVLLQSSLLVASGNPVTIAFQILIVDKENQTMWFEPPVTRPYLFFRDGGYVHRDFIYSGLNDGIQGEKYVDPEDYKVELTPRIQDILYKLKTLINVRGYEVLSATDASEAPTIKNARMLPKRPPTLELILGHHPHQDESASVFRFYDPSYKQINNTNTPVGPTPEQFFAAIDPKYSKFGVVKLFYSPVTREHTWWDYAAQYQPRNEYKFYRTYLHTVSRKFNRLFGSKVEDFFYPDGLSKTFRLNESFSKIDRKINTTLGFEERVDRLLLETDESLPPINVLKQKFMELGLTKEEIESFFHSLSNDSLYVCRLALAS